MCKLGFGTMRLPVDVQGNINNKLLMQMIDIYISNGFTYFDTAYGYMGQRSETALKECLVDRYSRDKFVIADKLTLSKIGSFSSLEDYYSAQLENLGVGFIDIYLVHGLDAEKYEEAKKKKCFEFIRNLKVQGKVNHIGISFHDKADILKKILSEQKELDYVQLQINYLDWEDDLVQSRKCAEVVAEYGKRITVMEPLKGGLLASFDEMNNDIVEKLDNKMSAASWGIRFAASQENVDYVLSGMNSLEQINNNTSYMKEFVPLDEKEMRLLFQLAEEYKRKKYVQCTGCRYCMDLCPIGIETPFYMQMLNNIKRSDNKSIFYNSKTYYQSYSQNGKGPSECIECGRCEQICPQKLSLRTYLKEVKQILG